MQDYEQAISQMSERRLRLMQVAQQKIEMELKNAYTYEQSALNQEHKLNMARAVADAKDKLAREKAKAQNRSAMWSAVGTVVGGVAGALIAGPAGAQLGATLGGGLGSIASTVE